MILTGYLAIFTYIFFLVLGVGNILYKNYNVEISRKVIHTGLFGVWILMDIFIKNTIHQIIIPIIFIVLTFISYKFKVFRNMEREDDNQPGTVYFAIAIAIIMLISYIFPNTYYSSGIATFCLTFGDGFAALIGQNKKSKKIKDKKSINGFLSCFIISTIAIFLFSYFYKLNLNIATCIVIGIATAIFELVGKGLDNFSIVGGTFTLSIVFLNYYNQFFLESILIAEILFIVVFLAKGLDYYGSVLAMVIFVLYMNYGGTFALSLILAEYFFIFFVAIFKKKILKVNKKEKPRTFLQVLINGGLGTLFIILYGIFKQQYLLIISVISLSGCLIDSVSSDVGTISKKDPYDFIKRKIVPRGMSGGITLLGTISALIVSIIIAFATYKYLNLTYLYFFLITCLIFFQTIIDSVLGSLVQAKYMCVKCKKMTEKIEHCDEKTKLINGIHWMNNNMVNTLSSVITTSIATIVLLILK